MEVQLLSLWLKLCIFLDSTRSQGDQAIVTSPEWDGEWEGALPDAPVSSRPFQPFGDVRVWPSIWRLAPDIWSYKSLDLVAIVMTVMVMN